MATGKNIVRFYKTALSVSDQFPEREILFRLLSMYNLPAEQVELNYSLFWYVCTQFILSREERKICINLFFHLSISWLGTYLSIFRYFGFLLFISFFIVVHLYFSDFNNHLYIQGTGSKYFKCFTNSTVELVYQDSVISTNLNFK